MRPLTVIVVEDETALGLLFAEVLEGMGHVVCAIAASETAAVASARRFKPDLMLVDVHLAAGNGISAVDQILSGGFVPHVFFCCDISGVQASRPRAVAIQKPFRVEELSRAITRALDAATPVSCAIA